MKIKMTSIGSGDVVATGNGPTFGSASMELLKELMECTGTEQAEDLSAVFGALQELSLAVRRELHGDGQAVVFSTPEDAFKMTATETENETQPA